MGAETSHRARATFWVGGIRYRLGQGVGPMEEYWMDGVRNRDKEGSYCELQRYGRRVYKDLRFL
jgi:hypothetical protein